MFSRVMIVLMCVLGVSCTKEETGTVTPQPVLPAIVGSSALPMSTTSVVLRGWIQPNGLQTVFHFEYGADQGYGSRTTDITISAASPTCEVKDTLVNLQPGSVYHFRLVASSSAGKVTGSDSIVTMPDSVVPTPMDFDIPFAMGKTWVYDYNYTLAFFDLSLTTIHGVQTWEVTSVNAGPLSTTYALGAFARDTVHISERRPPDGAWWDTTYVTERTLPLSADVSRDSINFHWLAMVRLQPGTPRFLEHLPRVVPAGNDTLALSGDYGLKNALYVAGLGLVKYTGYIPHSLGSEIETLVLSPIR